MPARFMFCITKLEEESKTALLMHQLNLYKNIFQEVSFCGSKRTVGIFYIFEIKTEELWNIHF